jgi:5-methylthioadenosine/S-adenosylhomocysteine deaminase
MILIDATTAHAVPGEDVYATIVYSLKSSDVTDVWVAGRQLVKDRRPTALDEASIKARAIGWRRKIKP